MAAQVPKPWERPNPIPTVGDTSAEDIYRAVGLALSRWEAVENALVLLFARITRLEFDMALSIYGNLHTSSSKQDMVKVAAMVRLRDDEPRENYLKALLKIIKGFSERRTDIAHGIAVQRNGWLLTSPFHSKRAFSYDYMGWESSMTSAHINDYQRILSIFTKKFTTGFIFFSTILIFYHGPKHF